MRATRGWLWMLSLTHAVTLAAQGRRACPPPPTADTAAFLPCHVDEPPQPDPQNPVPPYPELLLQAGIEGSVRVRLVVDTAGRPEPATVKVLRSSNAGFDQSIKRAVVGWRFSPARRGARPVRVQLLQEFAFIPPRQDGLQFSRYLFGDSVVAVTRQDTLADGTPRLTLDFAPPRPAAQTTPLTPDVSLAVREAAAAAMVAEMPPDSTGMARIVCIAIDTAQTAPLAPEAAFFARLTGPRLTVLPLRRCPRTFASMIQSREPSPPGEDPTIVRIGTLTQLSATRVVVATTREHGTGGLHFQCGAELREGLWIARCRQTGGAWFY